jgi:hypothetical protein
VHRVARRCLRDRVRGDPRLKRHDQRLLQEPERQTACDRHREVAVRKCKRSETAIQWSQQGPKGDRGVLGFYQRISPISVPPLDGVREIVRCDAGDRGTGGGYFLNTGTLTDAQLDVEVYADAPITDFGFEGTGWDVGIRNKTTTPRHGFAMAVCADLTP